MKYTNDELCLIWLDSFLGLEYKYKIELYDYISNKKQIKSALLQKEKEIVSLIGQKEFSTLLQSANQYYLDFVIKGLEKSQVTAITIESSNYPESLRCLSHPPLVLYTVGDISLLKGDVFGIVGSRKSLPLSIQLANSYTEAFCNANLTVVTGIAEGVDSAVITSALGCGGRVISVIAGGIENVYPKSNQDLLSKVKEHGLVISEYPPETVPKPFHFPVRNRIISAISKGVLIVSGGLKSGTLYTAEYAVECGRDLFAIPYSVGIQSGAGCNELIKRGALLTDSPMDILDFYGLEEKQEKIQLDGFEKEIVNLLSDGDMHIEKLSSVLNKSSFEITPVLSILEIKKIIFKSGNIYGLIRNDSEE